MTIEPSSRAWSVDFFAEFTTKDLILYALSVGYGSDESELRFVYENHNGFRAVPTFPLVLSFWACTKSNGKNDRIQPFPPPMTTHFGSLIPSEFLLDKSLDLTETPLIHVRQKIVWHQRFPVANASIQTILRSRIKSVVPKTRGTFITAETVLHRNDDDDDDDNATRLCTMEATSFLVGVPKDSVIPYTAEPPKHSWIPPDQPPTFVWNYATTSTQALLYRLGSGDSNVIHVDPSSVTMMMAILSSSGKPLLHGLCTLGIAVRGIIHYFETKRTTDDAKDELELKSLEAQFTKPVFVGDKLTLIIWDDSTGTNYNNKNGLDQSIRFRMINSDDKKLVVVDQGCLVYSNSNGLYKKSKL